MARRINELENALEAIREKANLSDKELDRISDIAKLVTIALNAR